MGLGKWIRRKMFSLPYREIAFDYRGFGACDPAVKKRIELYFTRFLDGYHFAVEADDVNALGSRLDAEIERELIGFAYEGAGMYLALLDYLTPWKRGRVDRFIAGPAARHDMITLIGIGLIFSRLPWVRMNVPRALSRLDPGVCWFAVDGYGFHEGFFHHDRYVDRCVPPSTVSGYAANVFDNGLGRSIWFVKGADPDRIAGAIQKFPEGRRADLWAGMGLACAFAGGVHEDFASYRGVLDQLDAHGAQFGREMGMGVVFAADTRFKADTESRWTSYACERLLGISFEEAGRMSKRILDETRAEMADASPEKLRAEGYERARQKIMAEVDVLRRALPKKVSA